MKVALYARVSTEEQHADKQIDELRRYAELCRHEVVGEYIDVISGLKDSRPQLDMLMKSVFKGEVDAVIVWKLDRLGRSMKHLVSIMEQLESRKVGFISTTQGFDTTKPEGKLLYHIFGAIAQFERELISARTKMGIKGTNVGKRGKDKKVRKKGGYLLRYMKHEVAEKYK
jgi:DNA invertase Pin-like site-specific DNA recombinase